VHASVEATFSAFQELKALILLPGPQALRTDATSQQLLLPLLSLLPLGLVPTLTLIKLSPKHSALSKDQSAVASRTSISVKLAKRLMSTLHLLLVKLATTRLDLSKDSPLSNPQILLASKSKTLTLMMTIFKMEEECFREDRMQDPRKASTKLKMRERKKASKLNLKLLSLQTTILLVAEVKTTALNLLKDLKLASSILQIPPLKNSREAIATSQSLLRRLDTSRFL